MRYKIKQVHLNENYYRPYKEKNLYELKIELWVLYENGKEKYYETTYERFIYDIPMPVLKFIKEKYEELPF